MAKKSNEKYAWTKEKAIKKYGVEEGIKIWDDAFLNVTATVYFDRMFEYDQTVNNLRWQGHIVLSGDGFQNASVTSMTVKIYSKFYPSIYCYSTITFTDNE